MTALFNRFKSVSATEQNEENTSNIDKLHRVTEENSKKLSAFTSIIPWLPLYLAVGGLILGNLNAISEINQRAATLQAQIGKINEDIVDLHNDIREDRSISQQILQLMVTKK